MELHLRRHVLRRARAGEKTQPPAPEWVQVAEEVLEQALDDPEVAQSLTLLLEVETEDLQHLLVLARQGITSGVLVFESVPAPTPLPGLALDPVTLARLAGQPIDELSRDEETAVAIELVDDDDQPLEGVRYRIEFPDGSSAEGRTNSAGRAVFWGLTKSGQCRLVLPDADDEAWEHVGSESL